MKGYSKISVLAMTAALGTTVFFGGTASAQMYSPVSVDDSVQVNWDVADGFGGQPTVPQYLSPSVSREHIVMPGGDLIYPETKPRSEFLAAEQFAAAGSSDGFDGGYETVVIDGAGSGAAFPTKSEFYGVPGVSPRETAAMDDGANQTIALRQPEPTSAPRSKPAAPTMSSSSAAPESAPTPLTKPAPAPVVAQAEPTPTPAPAPATETAEVVETPKAPVVQAEENTAPAAPAAPAVAPIASSNEVPPAPAPAPDTTQPATSMAANAPVAPAPAAPAATPAPAAEEAAIPPSTSASEPMPSLGADEYSLAFGADSFELSDNARRQLDQVIAAMGRDDSLRIQLQAYAQGDGANASKARRLSLSRALQVRSYLIDQGVRSTRIDVRALGSNVPSGPADRVDIKTVQR
ncbi:MAG: OmpA family protein [Thalassospira sp.]|uniref:OmpA family protein n=1 Tax=Thalassospira sp. TaxID=1912094 RepID=UPI003A8669CE